MKRRLILAALIIVSTFSLLTAYNNCGNVLFTQNTKYGGVVGNPMNPTLASEEILSVICSVINRCSANPISISACMSGVSSTNGIGQDLGLPAGTYDPYSSIETAESSGQIVANSSAATACEDDINNLSCSPAVLAAYNPVNPNPFSAVPNMIPASCNNVFTQQAACPQPTGPAYTVNDLGDGTDSTPGDHICATATGTCTLRAAIVEANADGGSANIVMGIPGTITVGSPLPLTSSVSIYGNCNGQTIVDGGSSTNIFYAQTGNLNISMSSLRIQNGLANAATGGAAFGSNYKAGINLTGSMLYFYKNISTGGSGGAVNSWNGSFNCNQCVFDSNQTTGALNDGGALFSGPTNGTATLNISQSLFVNNVSGRNGGAIAIDSGPNTIVNSTFYNNSAPVAPANGGAINVDSPLGTTITNCTLVNNAAPGAQSAGGIDGTVGYPVTAANNILYNNTGGRGNCGAVVVTSNGGNLISPASATCTFNQATDISVAPNLGPLQNNGGFSSTLELLSGSSGIGGAVLSSCPPVDQRGDPRSTDGTCDIGAFETQ